MKQVGRRQHCNIHTHSAPHQDNTNHLTDHTTGQLQAQAAKEAAAREQQERAAALRGGGRRGAADDLDLLEEEQSEAARLAALLPRLQEEAARERQGDGGGGWQPRSAGEQLREAQSRLARLKASTAGPPEFEPAVQVRVWV